MSPAVRPLVIKSQHVDTRVTPLFLRVLKRAAARNLQPVSEFLLACWWTGILECLSDQDLARCCQTEADRAELDLQPRRRVRQPRRSAAR